MNFWDQSYLNKWFNTSTLLSMMWTSVVQHPTIEKIHPKCHKQHTTTIKLQFFENLRFSPASRNSTSHLPIHCTCFCGGAEKITAHISPHIMLFSSIYEALKVTNIRICLENMHRDRCLKAYWQTGLIYLFWLND